MCQKVGYIFYGCKVFFLLAKKLQDEQSSLLNGLAAGRNSPDHSIAVIHLIAPWPLSLFSELLWFIVLTIARLLLSMLVGHCTSQQFISSNLVNLMQGRLHCWRRMYIKKKTYIVPRNISFNIFMAQIVFILLEKTEDWWLCSSSLSHF